MAKHSKKAPLRSKRASSNAKKGTPAPAPQPKQASPNAAASRRFVEDLRVRGEAQELDSSGKLPPEATHELKKLNPDGSAEVQRLRYKLY